MLGVFQIPPSRQISCIDVGMTSLRRHVLVGLDISVIPYCSNQYLKLLSGVITLHTSHINWPSDNTSVVKHLCNYKQKSNLDLNTDASIYRNSIKFYLILYFLILLEKLVY